MALSTEAPARVGAGGATGGEDEAPGAGALGDTVAIFTGGVMGTVTLGCRVGDGDVVVAVAARLVSRAVDVAPLAGAGGEAATVLGQREA